MRCPSCTSACWMWRGCLSSFKYSVSCLSESWRPNQVFHQNRNGMSTISQAVTKNSKRLRVDMRWRAGGAWVATFSMERSDEFPLSQRQIADWHYFTVNSSPPWRPARILERQPCPFLGNPDREVPKGH